MAVFRKRKKEKKMEHENRFEQLPQLQSRNQSVVNIIHMPTC